MSSNRSLSTFSAKLIQNHVNLHKPTHRKPQQQILDHFLKEHKNRILRVFGTLRRFNGAFMIGLWAVKPQLNASLLIHMRVRVSLGLHS